MLYGDKIKYLRDRNDVKAKRLADILKISKSLYSEYENETKTIPVKYLNKICNYFDVSIDYVFGFTNVKKYKNLKEDINLYFSGQRLKSFRKEQNVSQKQLGVAVGCSYGTIAGYEMGRYLMSTIVLYRIYKKYNISADYLLGKIDEPKYLD